MPQPKIKMEKKKSIMGPVISVFVMVLVISILAGLTFLFVAELKDNVLVTTLSSTTVTNESVTTTFNETGAEVTNSEAIGFRGFTVIELNNGTDTMSTGNYTTNSSGWIFPSALVDPGMNNTVDINFTYSYNSVVEDTAYLAVNDTENAGAGIVVYLPLIFLAIIFGAILTIVLRIILPYINLGQTMGGF